MKIIIRGFVVVALNLLAFLSCLISHVVLLHDYAWTEDPLLQDQVNSDGILVIVMFAIFGLFLSWFAFLVDLTTHHRGKSFYLALRLFTTGTAIFCIRRLEEVAQYQVY